MSARTLALALATLLGASLLLNAWQLSRARSDPSPESVGSADAGWAAPNAHADASRAQSETAASLVALVKSVEAARHASASASPRAPDDAGRRAPVDGFGEGRVTRALLDDIQCRVAREKATEVWRKQADSIRDALLRSEAPTAQMRAATLAGGRAALADVIGVDEGDARVGLLAEELEGYHDEAGAEVRRLVALDPPDWRAALDAVRGMYRQQDGAVHRVFGAAAADDWRMNEVDQRAVLLAIGASLVGVPWESVDDRTPPSQP